MNCSLQSIEKMQQPFETCKTTKARRLRRRIAIIVGLIAILSLGSYTFYYKNYVKSAENSPQNETFSLISDIGKHMVLPSETPVVATVVDKEKVQHQAFFAQAENGDKVLAYTKAMKAVLYRPSTHMVIEVAPIIIPTQHSALEQEVLE